MLQKILFLLFLSGATIGHSQNKIIFDFIWSEDSINGKHYEKTAMLIPVRTKTDSNIYYFQFDTGANTSSLYVKDKKLIKNIITDSLESKIGLIHFNKNENQNAFLDHGHLVVGTIGSDILKNKVLEIDFPCQKLEFLSELDTSDYSLFPITLSYGRPVLKVLLNNESFQFLFDTGSSIFELWTTKKIWQQMKCVNCPSTEMLIWAWGKQYFCSTSELQNSVTFGTKSKINTITYSSNKHYRKTFKAAHVSGVIGNKPYINDVIIIDLQSHQFGIKKQN